VRSFAREEAEKDSYAAISAQLEEGYRHQLDLIASGRLMLELLAAGGMGVIFVLAYRLHGVDQASLIAVCLLLGRLLPYLLSTRQNLQQVHSALPAWELWQRYMGLQSARPVTAQDHVRHMGGALHIEHLRLAPPLTALDVQGLTLRPGTLTLIFGDSGIGKSSLMDVLAGMSPPAAFAARMGERPIDFDAYRQLVRRGAYVSQSVRPWQLSVRDCLLWAAPDATDDLLCDVLADVGFARKLAGMGDDWSAVLKHSPSRLSGGELQRLLLAQVMLRQPFIALLDEATSALDAASEMSVLSALKRRLPHTIMVVVSHRHGVADVADQCLAIGEDRATTLRRNEVRASSG
jgi:ATP-binding cassette subfamily C protein